MWNRLEWKNYCNEPFFFKINYIVVYEYNLEIKLYPDGIIK